METELLQQRATVFAALGDPIRLAVAEALLLGDRTPASLSAEFGVPSNLMAHHSGILVDAGVVRRHPSERDRRRTYMQLTATGAETLRPNAIPAHRVVFVCTHNSARSQFAEALWRDHSDVPVESGGTHPAARVNPMARKAAQRRGLNLRGAAPKQLSPGAVGGALLVTVCDSADEELLNTPHLHWSVPDPVGRPQSAFLDAFDTIKDRVERLSYVVTLEES